MSEPEEIKTIEGRQVMWTPDPFPGGWVCAEPDENMPDGLCRMPTETEPCTVHHPWQDDE